MTDATFYKDVAGRYPLLTPEEEISLARDVQAWQNHPSFPDVPAKIQRRGLRARERLVQSNLRLVVYIARKFERRLIHGAYDMADVLQDGNMGLMRAAEKFDPGRGYKFSTYAFWWVKQSISRGLQSRQRLIRPPTKLMEAISRSNKVYRELATKLGRLPSQAELADGLGLTVDEYRHYQRLQSIHSRLDATVPGCEDRSLLDVLADPASVDQRDADEALQLRLWSEQVADAWPLLADDEQELISRHFGLNGKPPEPLHTLAKRKGITKEGLRQRLRIAQRKLRHYAQHPHPEPRGELCAQR